MGNLFLMVLQVKIIKLFLPTFMGEENYKFGQF